MPSPGRDHVRPKQEPGAERHADAAARAALTAGPTIAGLAARTAPPAKLNAGPAVTAMLARPGEPLPAPDRTYFERRFGADLSDARIHRDATAAKAARSQHARAFTAGRDIGFAAGAYQPDTTEGAHLLAHELAHTLQPGAEHTLRRQPDGAPLQSEMEPAEEQVSRPAPFVPAGGEAGDHLLRNYPMLAAKLTPDQWTALALAAERRETAHATNTSQAGEAPKPMTFALTDLLEAGAAFEDVDSADVLFGLFRAGAQNLAAPTLIRNEIMRRWFIRNGIPRPAEEKIEVTLLDPEGQQSGTTTFSFRWRGKEVEDTYGQITVAALDEAIGGIRFEFRHVAGEVRQEAEAIGLAAALSVQADVLKQKLPAFIEKTRARFASTALEEVLFYQKLVQEAAEQAYKLRRHPVAEGFVPGLYDYYDTQSHDLYTLAGQAQDWRVGKEVLGQKQELTQHDVELRLRDKPRDSDDPYEQVSLLYARGQISHDDMKDLHQSMLDRSLIVALVSVAISLATAGLGGWVAGSLLNLGSRPILYGAVAVGTNMAVDTVATMGTEHIVTAFKDYENPYAQAIWRQGAHSPGEYLRNAAIAFGLGALLGGALGYALTRGPKPNTALAPTETPPTGGGTANEPRLTLLSDTTDPASGVRTWQLRTDQGELVTVVGDPATGNGYIWNAATAEARQIVGGKLSGPLRLLGSGDAAGAAAAGATAGKGQAPFAVLSDITDPLSSVRTVQLRTTQGELVTVSTSTEAGSGYIMNHASGEARSIVNGQLGGPLQSLGTGAEEAAEAATPLMLQPAPAPLSLPPGVFGPQLPGAAVTGGAAAGEAAIEIELRQAFADIGMKVSADDRRLLADALGILPQLPPSAARDNVLALEPVVGAALAGAEGHVDAGMRILREAQREGLTLGQLIQQQRAAWAQLEPQLKSGAILGLGVGSADPRAVYSRAMIRLSQQAGHPTTVVPRTASHGDMSFLEGPVAQNPTLYDEAINAVQHGWHPHAVQDLVAGAALQRAGAPLDAFGFRQALGEIQQIGQMLPPGPGLDAIRMRQLGHLIWQAHYDAYDRPEFITQTLRKVLGYID